MLWPLVLPFQITVVAMIVLAIGVFWFAKRRKWPAGSRVNSVICLPALLFIPFLVATTFVADHFRFGMFHYPDYAAINDFRVERYMPQAATDITVFKHFGGNGYRARFKISQHDFYAWHDAFWDKCGEYSNRNRPDDDGKTASDPEHFQRWFGQFNWSLPADAVNYQSPVAANGAHYEVEYSQSQGVAFITACYW
jgi:hypothetical protein